MADMQAEIKVNRDIGAYKAGQTVKIDVDAAGVPLNGYWRRRLQDAQHDGCCEVVAEKAAKQRSTKRIESEDRGGIDE